jgi:hypothetical protein
MNDFRKIFSKDSGAMCPGRALDRAAIRFAAAADEVSGLMVRALRAALFDDRAKPATDTGLFAEARNRARTKASCARAVLFPQV